MAIVVAALAEGDSGGGGGSSYTLGSCTPSGSGVQLIFVYDESSTAPTSVTGCGITFTLGATSATNEHSYRCYVYYGHVASPSTGSVTIDWGSGTHYSQARMVEVTGCKLTGTNGVDAIVQFSGGQSWYTGAATTGATETLAAFADAVNNAAVFMCKQRSGSDATEEGGYTKLATYAATYGRVEAEYKVGQDTSPSMTWPSHTSDGGAFALEVAAVAVAAGPSGGWPSRMNLAQLALPVTMLGPWGLVAEAWRAMGSTVAAPAAATGWGALLSDKRNRIVQ